MKTPDVNVDEIKITLGAQTQLKIEHVFLFKIVFPPKRGKTDLNVLTTPSPLMENYQIGHTYKDNAGYNAHTHRSLNNKQL